MLGLTYYCVDCDFETFDPDLLVDSRCIGCQDNHEDAERDRIRGGWNPFDYD
jgi:hypothetical protein